MTMGSIGVKAEEEIILSESFNDGLPSGWSNDAYGGGVKLRVLLDQFPVDVQIFLEISAGNWEPMVIRTALSLQRLSQYQAMQR